MKQESMNPEEELKLKQESKQESGYIYNMPNYLKPIVLSVTCILLVILLCVTIYRYTLIGKAIDHKSYSTALALSAPELGLGISTLSAYIL